MIIIIKNPVLKGFNPDPSAVWIKGYYYIITSSFIWNKAIRVYRTKDLVNYELFKDIKVLNLKGISKDCGVWAPQISYVDNEIFLVYTIVYSTKRPFKDCHNYLIRSKDLFETWSKPIYLNSSGFDPSFFHEGNKSYLLNTLWDYRVKEHNKSVGIIIQEFDRFKNKLLGNRKLIFGGTEARKTEASHIYKFKDYYYLITAEGGTGDTHQVTVCRSKNIFGPYEVDPLNPMMSSKDNKDLYLQCTGHASIVETKNNELYMFFLSTRVFNGVSILGRETSINKIYLSDDHWLRLDNGFFASSEVVRPIESEDYIEEEILFTDNFEGCLKEEWNYLRVDKLDFIKFNNGLIITSGESLQSLHNLHLIGIRQNAYNIKTNVICNFNPFNFNQMAGIGFYLNEENNIFFYITYDEVYKKCVRLFKKEKEEFHLFDEIIPVRSKETKLEIVMDEGISYFYVDDYKLKSSIDCGFLSGGFTGNFIVLSCVDLNKYKGSKARFNSFLYKENKKIDLKT